jgi:alginate O-acetyltransferase complex protein AlgI
MLFNSLEFVALVAVAFVLYYAVQRWRAAQLWVLIAASLIFYAYHNISNLWLLAIVAALAAAVSYVNANDRLTGRLATSATIVVLLLLLGFFKYKGLVIVPFLPEGSSAAAQLLALGLPVGISFFVFQAISVLVDSYRDPESLGPGMSLRAHLRNTFFYVIFFPHLVAGPIVKAHDFLPQIAAKRFREIDVPAAVHALVVGYFLKVFVADNLAQFTVTLPHRSQWEQLGSSELLAMLVGYSAQIYADFAGYSLIAIGIAHLFGYRLMQNFNLPYLSRSLSEFWRRWHISLSTWLREYLYYPLGGNRKGALRTYLNLMIVMLLGGLWHGADWKFLVWGGWHGAALVIERAIIQLWPKREYGPVVAAALSVLGWALVLSTVTLGWLFFSLGSLADVLPYLGRIAEWQNRNSSIVQGVIIEMYVLVAVVALQHLWPLLVRTAPVVNLFRPYLYGTMLAVTFLSGGRSNPFIYFQF